MSEPVVQRQAVPDPQEALIKEARRGEPRSSWTIDEYGNCDGCASYGHLVLAQDVDEHNEPWLCESCAKDGTLIGRLADALQAESAAHQALRDAVSRLADELQKDAAHARKRQSDPADALALNRFLGDERAYLHAARRLRSLLGDKETQCPGL